MGKNELAHIRTRIIESYEQIVATDVERHPKRLAADHPRLFDYAWKIFDARQVLSILLSEQDGYPALKPILFSAFCTWVVCPHKPALRRHAMLVVGIDHLKQAEVLGRAAFPDRPLLGELTGRFLSLGQDFYGDFYYPIGGLPTILRAMSAEQLSKRVFKESKSVSAIVALMQVYDFHARNLQPKNLPGLPPVYYGTAKGMGSQAVQLIHRKRGANFATSIDALKDCWDLFSSNSSMIYAASTINFYQGSLLDVIQSGRANFAEHGHLLEQWVSRSRYIAYFVIKHFEDKDLHHHHLARLPGDSMQSTPDPPFSESERVNLEITFNRKSKLSNRGQNKHRATMKRR